MLIKKMFYIIGTLFFIAFAMQNIHALDSSSNTIALGDLTIAELKRDDLGAVEKRFDPAMKKAMPHEKFVEVMRGVSQQLGAMKRCDAPNVRQQSNVTILEYPCEFDQGKININLAYSADSQLAGLTFLPRKP